MRHNDIHLNGWDMEADKTLSDIIRAYSKAGDVRYGEGRVSITPKKLIVGMLSVMLLLSSLQVAGAKDKDFVMPEQAVMVIETNRGTVEVELFCKAAPLACENFIRLAEKGYYNGVIFHRVIKDFMIQGGDPTGTGRGGESVWGKPFKDEYTPELKFDKPGLLAMANAGPDTNGSQFFIATVKTPWLNGRHTIFGKVVKGYDVVKKIESVPTSRDGKPLKEQKILKLYPKKIGFNPPS